MYEVYMNKRWRKKTLRSKWKMKLKETSSAWSTKEESGEDEKDVHCTQKSKQQH